MLKKIYEELVTIRKELQAIRNCLESNKNSDVDNVAADVRELQNYVLAERAANRASQNFHQ